MNPSTRQQGLPGYRWIVQSADGVVCQRLARELHLAPLSSRILYHRAIRSTDEAERFLSPSLHQMRDPSLLDGMDRAVERLLQAILRRERVLIYGDYDVDGLTSTAILVNFLRHAGLNPHYHVPDRLREGYGFHPEKIHSFSQEGVQLIVTVDCGITAFDAVQVASQCGIDVIITDHHECSDRLPPALAVLNPKTPLDRFPFRELAGVGVAFYLIVALRSRMREQGMWGRISEPNLRTYLDLVALGTLADMVPLREENRIFVKYGLEEISSTKRPGVSTLKTEAGLKGPITDTGPLVYRIIPRINAPGRMGCALEALEILLCDEWKEAGRIARILENRNNDRKAVEEQMYREAWELAVDQLRKQDRSVLALASEGWHRGILGIVASRLAKEFRRTVVLLSFDGDLGKGSVRSFENLEFLDALTACKPFLEDFGGHQMAAGITLRQDSLAAFHDAFERAVVNKVGRADQVFPQVQLDAWLDDPGELTEQVMSEIERMAPFGYGNPEPVIGMSHMTILDKRIVGDNHLRLTLGGSGERFEAIGFQLGRKGIMESNHKCWDIVFTPRQEYWQGHSRLNLRLFDLQPS